MELLVVIATVGLLVALLLPAVQTAREAARRTQCSNNLRQIGTGLHSYHDAYHAFPVGCVELYRLRHAWSTAILPHIDQQAVFDLYDSGSHCCHSLENRAATRVVIATYLCPSTSQLTWDRRGDTTGDINGNGAYDPRDDRAYTDYGGMWGDFRRGQPPLNGIMVYDRAITIEEIHDGASNTIIVAEDTGRGWVSNGEWANGENVFAVEVAINQRQDDEIFSDHPGGAQVLFADGSVRFLQETLDLDTLGALCSRAQGEVVSASAW